MNIDENQSNADWIKAGKPLDTIAAIRERAAKEKQDWINRVDAASAKRREERNAKKQQKMAEDQAKRDQRVAEAKAKKQARDGS